MIPVLQYHLFHVANRVFFPYLIPDMLPAGNFGKHQKTDLVAAVNEVPALRIMRGTHRVQPELILQNIRVEPLDRRRHGIPHKGIGLMPVQSAELHAFTVQKEPVRTDRNLTEGEPRLQRLAILKFRAKNI